MSAFFLMSKELSSFQKVQNAGKPVLLCLHGGPGLDHSTLKPVLSSLSDMAQVIYLDQRGHGRSDRSSREHWTLAQWADDVREFCNVLGIENPIVLGVSFGGYVAMTYAIRPNSNILQNSC